MPVSGAPTPLVRNRPLLVLAVLAVCAGLFLPFLGHAPNRLVSGWPVSLLSAGPTGVGLLLLAGLLVAASFIPQSRPVMGAVTVMAGLLLVAVIYVAGAKASQLGATSAATARTSLGSSFWIMLGTAALIVADTLARADATPRSGTALKSWQRGARQLVVFGALALCATIMVRGGHLDGLSVMKEYANKADVFRQAISQHVLIVVAALLPTLLLGVPLGILAFRRSGIGEVLLPGLNIIQTIPSIALFGMLMAPLSVLAAAVPSLRALGISGIGLAPAVIALTLYCLLPIVRNTREGLAQVPRHVVDAAHGMGMTDRQVLWQVQLPLALPVFLSGLRITVVQAIGLAAVAALIGAGGLGSIMFQGLFSNALDLVLLGAVPIVVMVIVVDARFRLGVDLASGSRG